MYAEEYNSFIKNEVLLSHQKMFSFTSLNVKRPNFKFRRLRDIEEKY